MQITDNNLIVKSTMAHLSHTAFEKKWGRSTCSEWALKLREKCGLHNTQKYTTFVIYIFIDIHVCAHKYIHMHMQMKNKVEKNIFWNHWEKVFLTSGDES